MPGGLDPTDQSYRTFGSVSRACGDSHAPGRRGWPSIHPLASEAVARPIMGAPNEHSEYAGVRARLHWRDESVDALPGMRVRLLRSLRTGRTWRCRSERIATLLPVLDCMPEIRDVRVRPLVVEYVWNGTLAQAVPDLLVESGAKRELWVLTPQPGRAAHVATEDCGARCKALALQVAPHGFTCLPIDPAVVASPGALDIARVIRQFSRQRVDTLERELIRLELRDTGGASWADVYSRQHARLPLEATCRLIFEGYLRLSPSDRFRPNTRVELVQS